MTTEYKHMNQRQLGVLFGGSSHDVGRWLKEIGLRTDEGKPTQQAFNGGYVDTAPTGRGNGGYYYVWNAERTVAALEAAGHRRVGTPVPVPALTGPFTTRPSSPDGGEGDGYEIAGRDGEVGIWVRGQRNAERLVNLMNLAHRHGQFRKT